MTILEQLERRDQFTDIEEFIAEYILAHREEIYGWNLASLAKATCSSNATIVRMCRKLGFKGYKDFYIAFVVELEKQRREKREVDFDRPFDQSQGMWDVVKNTAELMKEAVDICYSSIDFPKMLRAAELIRHADNLYVYGVGDAYISGLSFANQLTKLGISVIHPMQYYESIAVSATARPTDVSLFLSYSGNLVNNLAEEMRILRHVGCKIILITSDTVPHNTDVTIQFPRREGLDGKISVFYSQTCFHYILNSIYGLIFRKDFYRNMDLKAQHDNVVRRLQRRRTDE